MDEFEIIDRFLCHQPVNRSDVIIPIGDDAAVLECSQTPKLVSSMDTLIGGVHFPADTAAEDIGHKCLAVNLSDLAAMGAEPAWAMLGLTVEKLNHLWFDEFSQGFFSVAKAFNVQLIGGDLTRGPLAICIQITGLAKADHVLTRNGARPGDLIYVSGCLGDAALGFMYLNREIQMDREDSQYFLKRFNRPDPRVSLGLRLTDVANAAIDISDGLASDLEHICNSSGVGAQIKIEQIPLSNKYRKYLDQVGWLPALSFGDDYELCFTIDPENVSQLDEIVAETGVSVTCIGRCMVGSEVGFKHMEEHYHVKKKGYLHFA